MLQQQCFEWKFVLSAVYKKHKESVLFRVNSVEITETITYEHWAHFNFEAKDFVLRLLLSIFNHNYLGVFVLSDRCWRFWTYALIQRVFFRAHFDKRLQRLSLCVSVYERHWDHRRNCSYVCRLREQEAINISRWSSWADIRKLDGFQRLSSSWSSLLQTFLMCIHMWHNFIFHCVLICQACFAVEEQGRLLHDGLSCCAWLRPLCGASFSPSMCPALHLCRAEAHPPWRMVCTCGSLCLGSWPMW